MPRGWRSLGRRAAAMLAPVRGRVNVDAASVTLPHVRCITDMWARMSVTHQLHLQLSPVNAALTFWRDGDRFRRVARASDGRGFGVQWH